jgi:vancomycin resistance protein YoaR
MLDNVTIGEALGYELVDGVYHDSNGNEVTGIIGVVCGSNINNVSDRINDVELADIFGYKLVDGIYYDTLVLPVDASVTFNPNSNEKFIITKEKVGYQIDREKLLKDIDIYLNTNKKTLNAQLLKITPKTTKLMIENSTYKIASFSTYYGQSQDSRKYNIRLAVEKLNGCILGASEVLSFNQIVGDRTENNGFLNSKVIENGVYVDGVGGGVCQVSTTLYNASLLSGLEILERHQHSIAPTYIEPSFDAMVSGSYCDLKIKNNSLGFIFIKGECDGFNVTFTIYGQKPKFSYRKVSKIIETYKPDVDDVILDSELLEGEKVYTRLAKDGVKSEGYLLTYNKNDLVSEKRLSVDKYKAVKGEIRVGTRKSNI